MKKLLLIVSCVIFAGIFANAQIYVGGGVGFWNDGDADRTTFNLTPEVGYNISDKLAAGAVIGFSYSKIGSQDANSSFTIAPYARYTYFNEGIFSLFVDGGLDLYTAKNVDAGFRIGFQPGFAVSLTDRFSLVSKFGFLGYSDAALYGRSNGFGFSFTNNVSFGFYVSL